MGDRSKIEWTEATWNPILGCSKVSPGCDHCYAVGVAHRGMSPQHRGLTVNTETGVDWNGQINVAESVLDKPLRWKRPRRVFVNSLSDLFHPGVSYDTIIDVFAVMALAEQHTFQVLTKRPQRMASLLAAPSFEERMIARRDDLAEERGISGLELHHGWPRPNIWLGVSIESDRFAWRARYLRATPAAVRWISAEPLLGPLPSLDMAAIDWLVVGGESGPGARPMHPEWVRELRDRCLSPGITRTVESHHGAARASTVGRGPAFFFKQWGDWAPGVPDQYGRSGASKTPTVTQQGVLLDRDGQARGRNELTSFRLPADWCQMARVGKKAAGRELDGRTWDEYPS